MQHGRGTLVALGHPRTTAGQVQRAWPAVRETFAEGRAPRTSLNQPIGAGRTLALVRCSLDQVKGIAHAHHATVNDVLSAAVASGLRTLLGSRANTSTDSSCGRLSRCHFTASNPDTREETSMGR